MRSRSKTVLSWSGPPKVSKAWVVLTVLTMPERQIELHTVCLQAWHAQLRPLACPARSLGCRDGISLSAFQTSAPLAETSQSVPLPRRRDLASQALGEGPPLPATLARLGDPSRRMLDGVAAHASAPSRTLSGVLVCPVSRPHCSAMLVLAWRLPAECRSGGLRCAAALVL